MINKKNILDLADALEADNEFPFDMSDSITCIMGFYYQKLQDKTKMGVLEFFGCQDISPNCEIDYGKLWMPRGWRLQGKYTKAQAVACLRNLAYTGKVEWK